MALAVTASHKSAWEFKAASCWHTGQINIGAWSFSQLSLMKLIGNNCSVTELSPVIGGRGSYNSFMTV